jgi:hypothetical protein
MTQKKKNIKSKKVVKSNKDEHKEDRIDWLRNQAIIQETYVNLIQQLKRCPTVLEVSKQTDLSISAIRNHVKEMKFEPQQSPLRSLTPDVYISIYNSCRKGSSQSQKLWMQIMEGWKEGTSLDIVGLTVTGFNLIEPQKQNGS